MVVYEGHTPTYQHTDHLGTVQSATNASGVALFQDYYTPFGEAMGVDNGPEQDLGLTAHIRDKSTGLTYMQARYYDPVVGRFLSVDPVTFIEKGHPSYYNRYTYTLNDPTNLLDPNGEEAYGANVSGAFSWGAGGRFSVEVAWDTDSKELRFNGSIGERVGAKAKAKVGLFREPSKSSGTRVRYKRAFAGEAEASVKLGPAEVGAGISGELGVEFSSDKILDLVADVDPYGTLGMKGLSADENGRQSFSIGGAAGASAGVDDTIDVSINTSDVAQKAKETFEFFVVRVKGSRIKD